MVDELKLRRSMIVARTVGIVANMSAHIIVAGYWRKLDASNPAAQEDWDAKIKEAISYREMALNNLGEMLAAIETTNETKETEEKESHQHHQKEL